MEAQGWQLAVWLACLLLVRGLAYQCLAYNGAKQLTAAEAAKTFALEWRMEATAHVASLMVRDQQCKGDPENCDLQEGASDAIETLSKWAVGDKGWERLLSSVSLYAIARHAYQEAEYDEAIIALEESLALRLFAYADQKTLDRWQQGLVMPGSMFRRQKMDLANTLVLRSDCLVQLAREQRDVDDLTEAMELLQLATALLKGGDELVPDSVVAITRRASTIAQVAVELLPQLKTSRVKEVLERHGISCTGCSSKADYLVRLVPLLRLPVRVMPQAAAGSNSGVGGIGSRLPSAGDVPLLEPSPDPFNSHATALLKKSTEHVAQYMQRVFFRLLTLVPADYLAELGVSCRRQDSKGRCINYLPMWVTAQAITIDKRTGMAHVSAPGTCAGDGSGRGHNPSLDVPSQPSSSSTGSKAGSSSSSSCGVGPSVQLPDEPLFVPGDAADAAAASSTVEYKLPAPEPHNHAGVELCGFLHIRAIPPGVNLPTTGGSLTPQQQKALKDRAAEGVASGSALNSPFKGVYYYFYTDISALVDRIINTFDPEEADFLFEQLDRLTAAKSLALAGRLNTPQPKNCNEQSLLEGKAPPACSVLVPNIGSCAKAPLKPPRRRIPADPIPAGLSRPPPMGTYTPRMRARASDAAAAAWDSRSGALQPESAGWSDGANGSGERGVGDGSGAGSSRGHNRQRHFHHHGSNGHSQHGHPHYALTDRELSDRQLQEQMAKLARDAGRRDRDDPLVPLTLAGCAVATFGLYLASKRRRRNGVVSTSGSAGGTAARLVLMGLGKGGSSAGVSSNGAGSAGSGTSSSAGLLGSGGSGSGGPLMCSAAGSPLGLDPGDNHTGECATDYAADGAATITAAVRQKRQVAAALRVAMNNTDTGKLEAALAEAEAVDLEEAGLLQRARVLLDKRRKKDQQKAAAEKAKLKAQRKEEARKSKRAAAKKEAEAAAAAAAAAVVTSAAGSNEKVTAASSCSAVQATGNRSSNCSRLDRGAGRAAGDPAARPGRLKRLLQMFGLGACPAAGPLANGTVSPGTCETASTASSGSLSRVSSLDAAAVNAASICDSPGTAAAAAAAAAAAVPGPWDRQGRGSKQQQQQQRSGSIGGSIGSGNSSASELVRATVAVAAGDDYGRGEASAPATHLLCVDQSSLGDGFDVISGGTSDVASSARSPATAAASSGSASAVTAAKEARSTSSPRSNGIAQGPAVSASGKRSRGKATQQAAASSAARAISGSSSRGSGDGSGRTSKAPSDAAEAAAIVEAAQLLQEQQLQAAKAAKAKAAQKAVAAQPAAGAVEAAPAAVVTPLSSSGVGKSSGQQEQQQLQRSSFAAATAASSAHVVPPVTPPASAQPCAGTANRSAPSHYSITPQHLHAIPAASPWGSSASTAARAAALSEDGGSSTSSMQQSGASTPAAPGSASKPKLNPKATPYNPVQSGSAASAGRTMAAGHTPSHTPAGAAGMLSFSSPGGASVTSPSADWRAVHSAAAAAAGGYADGSMQLQVPLHGPNPPGIQRGSFNGLARPPGVHGLLPVDVHGVSVGGPGEVAGLGLVSPAGSAGVGGAGAPLRGPGAAYGHLHYPRQQMPFSGQGDISGTLGLLHPQPVMGCCPASAAAAAAAAAAGMVGLSSGPFSGVNGLDHQAMTMEMAGHPLEQLVLHHHQQGHGQILGVHQYPQQQQLMQLMSAAGPGDQRYGSLASAGGSAPLSSMACSSAGSGQEALLAAATAASQRSSYSSVPDYMVHAQRQVPVSAAPEQPGGIMFGGGPGRSLSSRGAPPGFEGAALILGSSAGQQQKLPAAAVHSSNGTGRPGVLPLSLDDDQLPPGFSAEDYSGHTPAGIDSHHLEPMPAATAAVSTPGDVLPSPSSIPTTAPLGVFAPGSSVWAPLAATAGSAASSVAASVRSLWPTPLAAANTAADHAAYGDSYSQTQDLEVEVAAAATSTNVAELVLGSSPNLTSGASDAQMNKLAKEIMAIVAE